jgi:hypothetical protein
MLSISIRCAKKVQYLPHCLHNKHNFVLESPSAKDIMYTSQNSMASDTDVCMDRTGSLELSTN